MSSVVRPGFDRFLSARNCYDASFSPDGERVYFLSDLTGYPELWAVEAAGGWPDQLTFFRDRVMGAHPSPVTDEVIVGRDVGGNEREQFFQVASESGDLVQLTAAPETIHTFGDWSRDGTRIAFSSNRRNPFYFDVYTRDVQSGAERRVLTRDGTYYARAWTPDGRAILVARVNRSQDNDLLLLDPESGETTELTPHEGFAQYLFPAFTPDGGRIWCVSDEGSDFAALGYVDVAARRFTPVVSPEWDVEALALTADGARLAYAVNADGYSQVTLRDTQSGQERPVEGLPRGVVTFLKWSPDGQQLALTLTTPRQSMDVWLVNRDGSSARQLTRSPQGGLQRGDLADPQTIRYPTFDGREIPALFFRPDCDGPCPCVVHVHGGPESQVRPAWNPVIQYLVGRGYAVLAPNVRGSTGYGKTYGHLDDLENRMDAVADVAAGVEWLVAEGGVDRHRIAVMGASYGGFMTLASVTTYPNLWAAAVDVVGIANFITFFERTGPWRRQHRASEYGDPATQADLLRRISPIHRVDQIQAPLFVLHGQNDPRVPVEEAELIVGSLRERGRPVEYLLFDDEGHGVVKLGNRIVAYTRIADFLDRHLGAPSG